MQPPAPVSCTSAPSTSPYATGEAPNGQTCRAQASSTNGRQQLGIGHSLESGHLGEFRLLAPPRIRVDLQTWSSCAATLRNPVSQKLTTRSGDFATIAVSSSWRWHTATSKGPRDRSASTMASWTPKVIVGVAAGELRRLRLPVVPGDHQYVSRSLHPVPSREIISSQSRSKTSSSFCRATTLPVK